MMIPTGKGSANQQSHPIMLERVVLIPARQRFPDGKLLVLCDMPGSHQLTPELADMLVKYDAILHPFPANSSTVLDPLDVSVFRKHKAILSRLFNKVNLIYENPTAYFCPDTLDVKFDTTLFADARQRALGMGTSADILTRVIACKLAWHHIEVESMNGGPRRAADGFALAGLVPFDPQRVYSRVGGASVRPTPSSGHGTRQTTTERVNQALDWLVDHIAMSRQTTSGSYALYKSFESRIPPYLRVAPNTGNIPSMNRAVKGDISKMRFGELFSRFCPPPALTSLLPQTALARPLLSLSLSSSQSSRGLRRKRRLCRTSGSARPGRPRSANAPKPSSASAPRSSSAKRSVPARESTPRRTRRRAREPG